MDQMQMRRVIERKRDGEELSAQEWQDVIAAYMRNDVDDAQMSAMAMACVWRGLSIAEAAALTNAMVASGETLQYPSGLTVVDKHSSGGVSDIVSLVAVPIVAACGVHVAKLSGRALGHTGGTIDKLETIPGINLTPSMEAFVRQVERVGCAIAAQTDAFVPADKRLYKLRDRTATVPAIGLIASSIVSKKIAAGASAFVFDVKCGSASFMKTPEQAIELANVLVAISRQWGKRARAIVSDMNEPLGRSIGTGIEVIEARDFLQGLGGDRRLREQCLQIAVAMMDVAGAAFSHRAVVDALESGAAYAKFVEMIVAQGGSQAALESLKVPSSSDEIVARADGFIGAIDGVALGNAARELSAGNATGGIRLVVRSGFRVKKGDVLAEVFGDAARVMSDVHDAFQIVGEAPPHRPLVYSAI